MHSTPIGWLAPIALTTAVALLAGCASPLRQAENQAETQRLNTPLPVEVLSPPFDEAQAKRALAKGSTTVKGVLYHKIINGGKHGGQDAGFLSFGGGTPVANAHIWIYPATAQAREVLRLTKENQSQRQWNRRAQRKTFSTDPLLIKYRLQTRTDANGLFEFTEMLPGHYVVASETFDITSGASTTHLAGVSHQQTGAMVSGYGVTPIYSQVTHTRTENFRVNTPVRFEELVEVPSNKKVVEVEARMRPY